MQQRRLTDNRKPVASPKPAKLWRKRFARLCAAAGVVFAANAIMRS
ncbi:hypothetical protein K3757_13570 [Sulfitobacter sp. S223]|nr:hypothetical protein [Sulfitobacter sp. S223]UWR25481.1 hypothetical protein K3757_13570 [Sulfitobacter sp. S223]